MKIKIVISAIFVWHLCKLIKRGIFLYSAKQKKIEEEEEPTTTAKFFN